MQEEWKKADQLGGHDSSPGERWTGLGPGW